MERVMIIFEDYETDALSRLYLKSYKEGTRLIKYSRGNGRLALELENILNDDKDIFVIVVLDMVPENNDIVTIYNNIKMLGVVHKEYEGRYIIIPNVCAEFRFINSFKDLPIFNSFEDLKICLNKGEYKESKTLNDKIHGTDAYSKSFENYCKFILKYSVIYCVSRDSVSNNEYDKFYTEDCCCANCEICDYSLMKKSHIYLESLPIILNEDLINNIRTESNFTYDDLYDIHVKLVNEFNEWVDRYKLLYYREGKKFRHVKPMSKVNARKM